MSKYFDELDGISIISSIVRTKICGYVDFLRKIPAAKTTVATLLKVIRELRMAPVLTDAKELFKTAKRLRTLKGDVNILFKPERFTDDSHEGMARRQWLIAGKKIIIGYMIVLSGLIYDSLIEQKAFWMV